MWSRWGKGFRGKGICRLSSRWFLPGNMDMAWLPYCGIGGMAVQSGIQNSWSLSKKPSKEKENWQEICSMHKRFIYLSCTILRRCWARTNACRRRKTCGSNTNRACVCFFLADTLNREPEHISSNDPEELVRKFLEGLVRRCVAIPEDIQRYILEDLDFLLENQQKLINQWSRYLIKKYFVTHIAKLGDVKVANKTRSCTWPHRCSSFWTLVIT